MADAQSVQSQPGAGKSVGQTETCPPDCDLPENSPENLDARLDHAIEETFPTSDPISVIVTKQPTAEVPREAASVTSSSQGPDGEDQAERDTVDEVLGQVKEALQDVTQTASGLAKNAYRQGQGYVRQARASYPEAERHLQQSRDALYHRITESPWSYLFAAAAAGYLLGWMIHATSPRRDQRVPDYARTRRGYASYRDDQHG
jgi:ElaB/YqjD/DUF883 family membrane-anchored ribosome-binding protein